jgi:hypothetical protein
MPCGLCLFGPDQQTMPGGMLCIEAAACGFKGSRGQGVKGSRDSEIL